MSLLTSLGDDAAGRELLMAATERGMETAFVHVSLRFPTDQYMAIEGANGLIAAIADAHSLEEEADQVIAPLMDGRVAGSDAAFAGVLVCEGNLPQATLEKLNAMAWLAEADVRLAPASPGKAERLAGFCGHRHATIYVNLIEANILLGRKETQSAVAAEALVGRGFARVMVTDGPAPAAVASADGVFQGQPPEVDVKRVTGAGDVFMASHIAAELRGGAGQDALDFALDQTARYISTEDPL